MIQMKEAFKATKNRSPFLYNFILFYFILFHFIFALLKSYSIVRFFFRPLFFPNNYITFLHLFQRQQRKGDLLLF